VRPPSSRRDRGRPERLRRPRPHERRAGRGERPLLVYGSGSCSIACEEYHRAMAYDEELAARVRELVSDEPALAEKKMFGGLAFLVGGNMAVGVSGQGGLLVRVDPEESDELVASRSAELMEMRGRSMR